MYERTATGRIFTPVTFDPLSCTGLDTETTIDATGVTVHTTQQDSGNWYVCATETADPASMPLSPGEMFGTEMQARVFETYLVHSQRFVTTTAGIEFSPVTRCNAPLPDDYSNEPCTHLGWICVNLATEQATMECAESLEACCGCCHNTPTSYADHSRS